MIGKTNFSVSQNRIIKEMINIIQRYVLDMNIALTIIIYIAYYYNILHTTYFMKISHITLKISVPKILTPLLYNAYGIKMHNK